MAEIREKIWLVTQDWKVTLKKEVFFLPIRSAVKAKTRRTADKKAAGACRAAQVALCKRNGCKDIGEPAGPAVALYPVGYADDPEFRKMAKEME